MKKTIAAIVILLAIGGGAFLYLTFIRATPIGELLKAPRNYDNKVVTISGSVTDRNNLLLYKYFKIKDDSGEIVVVTERSLPQVGDTLKIKGRIREQFAIGESQSVVFEEAVER